MTEAFGAQVGQAAASSYRLAADVQPRSRSVGNGRSEICWAVITPDGRYAFTTNFADGAVSRWALEADGTLGLEDATAGLTEDGRAGRRDEDLSRDGRFLYAIDADARRGRSVRPARWRRSAPGTACPAPSPGWRPASGTTPLNSPYQVAPQVWLTLRPVAYGQRRRGEGGDGQGTHVGT